MGGSIAPEVEAQSSDLPCVTHDGDSDASDTKYPVISFKRTKRGCLSTGRVSWGRSIGSTRATPGAATAQPGSAPAPPSRTRPASVGRTVLSGGGCISGHPPRCRGPGPDGQAGIGCARTWELRPRNLHFVRCPAVLCRQTQSASVLGFPTKTSTAALGGCVCSVTGRSVFTPRYSIQ